MTSFKDYSSIQNEAADWLVRQRAADFDAAQQQALERWLDADPEHAEALAHAEMLWELGSECEPLFDSPVAAAGSSRFAGVAQYLAGWKGWALAACLLLATGLGWQPLWLQVNADYRTAKGQVQEILLPDGTTVTLNTQSALAVDYDGRQRHVRLLKGEALFHPAPLTEAESRPFVVEAAKGYSQALGTVFLVRRDDRENVQVGVLEHSVSVRLADETLTLQRGETARYHRQKGVFLDSQAVLPQLAAGWSKGLLTFDATPLSSVLAQIGEYYPGLFMMLDQQAASTPVTAVFHLNTLDEALDLLALENQLQLIRLPGVTLIY